MPRLCLVFCLAFLSLTAAAQADAPAIWTVQGPKGRLTLFGSVHLLPPDVNWRTPALAAALEEAAVIVFETDIEAVQDPAVMQPLMARLGLLPDGKRLPDVLQAATYAELEKMAGALGLPVQALQPMRPWLAGLLVSVQFMRGQGYDPAQGVEQQVLAWAKGRGKALAGLETIEAQLRIFADLSPAQEAAMLTATLRQLRETPRLLDELLAAYRKADVAALDRILNASLNDLPALRGRVMRERHEAWLPQLERMLGDGRPHVVIVGAGHLAGPDSVATLLRARGHRVTGP